MRKEVVNRTFADERVFHDITKELRKGFKVHTKRLQQEVDEVVLAQLDGIQATFNTAKDKNIVEENERDTEFRQRVADEVAKARSLMGM